MNRDKTVSVRMSEDLIERLQVLALVEGETVGSEIRMAVEDRIEARRRDPEFQSKVQVVKERQEAAMAKLSKV